MNSLPHLLGGDNKDGDRLQTYLFQRREDTTSCLDKITWLVIIPSILECIQNVYSVIAVDYARVLDL